MLIALQLVIAAIFAAACIAGWRFISRTWPVLGIIVGLGILVRAWAGVGLFLISFLNLPILSSLHTADGFWHLAPDARVYYELAARAASGADVPHGSPSPLFVETLGWWLRVTGLVPISAVLFNVTLYVASCVLVTTGFRPVNDTTARRGLMVTVSALTLSPMSILLSTQPLKDVFSIFLITLAGAGVVGLLRTPSHTLFRWRVLVPVAMLTGAVYFMAGVRAYYALFIWTAVALAIAVSALTDGRVRARRLCFGAGVLVLLWGAFMAGAGPYYAFYGNLVTRTLGVQLPWISPDASAIAALPPSEGEGVGAATSTVRTLRRGFVRSGGATNVGFETGSATGENIAALIAGLITLLVPITVLMQLSMVEFSGGRGFLLVTDLDTIFLDVAFLAVAWTVLAARRAPRTQWPFFCFAVGLGVTSALLMAYVVTNYGTAVRLRLLAAVPLWLVPLALAGVRQNAAITIVPAQSETDVQEPPPRLAVFRRGRT